MIILGIDPGIKNLGLCLARVDGDDVTILSWKCVEIDDSSVHRFTATFGNAIDMTVSDVTKLNHIDDVRIESQPTKNYRLKRVQHYIEMYFALLHPKLDSLTFVSPHKKKRYTCPGEKKQNESYYSRKQSSVRFVENYLDTKNTTWKEFFSSRVKKDDLAESLLLILVAGR